MPTVYEGVLPEVDPPSNLQATLVQASALHAVFAGTLPLTLRERTYQLALAALTE